MRRITGDRVFLGADGIVSDWPRSLVVRQACTKIGWDEPHIVLLRKGELARPSEFECGDKGALRAMRNANAKSGASRETEGSKLSRRAAIVKV